MPLTDDAQVAGRGNSPTGRGYADITVGGFPPGGTGNGHRLGNFRSKGVEHGGAHRCGPSPRPPAFT